ncbi:MAG: DNA replication/repair protein RecF [Clostridia bacterium]|nr:DNA replication/repair protein RecF [Clostridia bacterium]
MKVITFNAEGFRNLKPLRIEPCEGINVIYGDNGQGKTNLLEAIGLFTGMKSFRGARNVQMISHGGEFARLGMEFYAEGREQSASMLITDTSREVSINSVKQSAASALMGRFCAVVFSPDRMTLISGGGVERRKFIDSAISQSSPSFTMTLYKFNQILSQRNTLLKDIAEHPRLADTLDVWDTALASYGAAIACKRAKFVADMAQAASAIYEGISSGREPFSLRYNCSFAKEAQEMGEYEAAYIKQLTDSRQSDIKLGYTFHGPQRDDMDIAIGGKDARAFGSQGQKRSAVLALKLSEAQLLSQMIEQQPIALLDDVMSELDSGRQEYLLNKLSGWQVFITCCDPSPLRLMDSGKVFRMESGEISERA